MSLSLRLYNWPAVASHCSCIFLGVFLARGVVQSAKGVGNGPVPGLVISVSAKDAVVLEGVKNVMGKQVYLLVEGCRFASKRFTVGGNEKTIRLSIPLADVDFELKGLVDKFRLGKVTLTSSQSNPCERKTRIIYGAQ